MKKGQIICGFPAIGKSTLAKHKNYIDLDSSLFTIQSNNGAEKNSNWVITYINVAKMLANKGFTVFISTHSEVRNYLKEKEIEFTVIYPKLELEEAWIERLRQRFEQSGKDADFRAFRFIQNNYKNAVVELQIEKKRIEIESMDYSLIDLIERK